MNRDTDAEALTALCQQLAEHLGVPAVILITLSPGKGTGFSVFVPEQLAEEVPPTLWMLGDHFCQHLGRTPLDYLEDEPAGEDTLKH